MRRLVAGGLLPERAGQPVKALVHISLVDLLHLDGSSALMQEWIGGVRARWAAARAAASESGSDGGAWLDGKAAQAAACDASLTPIVTGQVDVGVLEELVRLCSHLDRLRRDGGPGGPAPSLREVLEQQVIRAAVALVSGPGGLASHLRRRQLGARLAGPSLPHDIGVSKDIPAAIRRAVTARDQHCRFPGGCDQPASACEVHHLTNKADGGKTSVQDCALFCTFHHQVVIHRWGLDRHPQPRRHHHRLEQRQNQDPPQPRQQSQSQPTSPTRMMHPAAEAPGTGEPPARRSCPLYRADIRILF